MKSKYNGYYSFVGVHQYPNYFEDFRKKLQDEVGFEIIAGKGSIPDNKIGELADKVNNIVKELNEGKSLDKKSVEELFC